MFFDKVEAVVALFSKSMKLRKSLSSSSSSSLPIDGGEAASEKNMCNEDTPLKDDHFGFDFMPFEGREKNILQIL